VIAKKNKISLYLGMPAILLQFLFFALGSAGAKYGMSEVGLLFLISMRFLEVLDAVAIIMAFSFYATAKGYSRYYGMLGIIWPLAIIILASLPDKDTTGPKETA